MFDISIELADLKNFFYKKTKDGNIRIVRLLGLTFKFTDVKVYNNLIKILKYIQPYLSENIDDLLCNIKKNASNVCHHNPSKTPKPNIRKNLGTSPTINCIP